MSLSARAAFMIIPSAILLSQGAQAQDIVRHPSSSPNAPMSSAVQVPASATTYYLSGQVPAAVNPSAPRESREAFGDTETQTISVLERIEATLKPLGLGMKDVVKMQVFLVADPQKNNKMDFRGFMAGYAKFFGKSQPNLPARSVMEVARLANDGWLVEIEVIAAKAN